jgi:uncharacterized protein (TIGR02145 family)
MSRVYCLVSLILIAVPTRAQTDSISDLEGNRYSIVKIGGQWWMAENLKVGKYRNGDPIAYIESDAFWASADSGAYCYYGNREQFRDITVISITGMPLPMKGAFVRMAGTSLPMRNGSSWKCTLV